MPAKKWIGHASAFGAYLIFGFNIIICKDITGSSILSPMGIFLVRSMGAALIFWLLSLFRQAERVRPRDFFGIFMAALLGFFLTQLTFLMAIPLITPMESSMLNALVPIFTMFIAAIALHEPITRLKFGGVLISFSGVIYLIVTGLSGGVSEGGINIRGVLFQIANGLCFAMYLGVFRPLIERYSVVTFMKWVFLFSILMALPFGTSDILSLDISALPTAWLWEMSFLIVFATFVAYFLIPVAQKIIRPTIISIYSYVQPIVAISASIWIGYDTLTIPKLLACAMIFGGLYLVSRSPAAPRPDTP